MKTTYEKPVCEIIRLETEEGIMSLSSGKAPASPDVNTSGGSSDEKNFWGR